jgi:hypothetical protein
MVSLLPQVLLTIPVINNKDLILLLSQPHDEVVRLDVVVN